MHFHSYKGICCICGAIATTREHRHKKSDVKREFGQQFTNSSPTVYRDGKQIPIQGPDSKYLKYEEQNLCQDCNTGLSSEMDRAYTLLQDYATKNKSLESPTSHIQFSKAFGPDFLPRKSHFLRYVAKYACCRLAEGSVQIPEALTQFVRGNVSELTQCTVHSFHRLDIWEMNRLAQRGLGVEYPVLEALPFCRFGPDATNPDAVSSGFVAGEIEFRFLVAPSISEKSFPGLSAYHSASTWPLCPLFSVDTEFAPILSKAGIPAQPQISWNEYFEFAHRPEFYKWFLINDSKE
tara:strand:- start:61 stop:939 length:879 start_codon:yes stop_codon:yes gene_type:complete